MSANPRLQEMKCWEHVFYLITKLNKNNLPMEYDELVLQSIRKYPVGLKQVDNHIKRFYIQRGIVVHDNETGMIIPPEYNARKKKDAEKSFDDEISALGVTPNA